jgi:8-oxo-dGTP diphosphatase
MIFGHYYNLDEGVLEWIDNEKVMSLNLWDGDKIYMKWLIDHPFFSAKFIYKKRILQSHKVVFYD